MTMLSSQTGFGQSSQTDDIGRVSVELKSVNSRFLQIDLHLPYLYSWADPLIRQYLNSRLARGKVSLRLEVVDINPSNDLIVNRQMIDKLIQLNQEFSKEKGINLPVSFDGLLSLPGIMKTESADLDTDKQWQRIEPVLVRAVDQMVETRKTEGANLLKDFVLHQDELNKAVDCIKARVPLYKEQYAKKFKDRITELLAEIDLDQTRLATEIAIWSDKSDITEEITRFESHLKELHKTFNSSVPIGRRIDFLLQELNREINTIGNKVADIEISQAVVDVKCSIEKIREQAQNIE